MVQRGEVDIGGGMFSLMKERAVAFSPKSLLSSFFYQAVVDFSNGISVEENTILMKTPRFSNVAHFDIFVIPLSICSQSQSKQWWAPFSPPVWLSIGLASISMALLMFLLISRIEINVLPDPPPKAMGPLQIVWFIFGALVKQVG